MEVENKELAWLGLESNPDMMNEFAKKLGLSEEFVFGDIFVFLIAFSLFVSCSHVGIVRGPAVYDTTAVVCDHSVVWRQGESEV
jgi:hypothetical protein